jgi:hypothetical protein
MVVSALAVFSPVVAGAQTVGNGAGGGAVAGRAAQPDGFRLRYVPGVQGTHASAQQQPSGWYEEYHADAAGDLSVSRAVLYSLLLPGLGDWYAGHRDRATAFFLVDAAVWTTFIVFRVQGNQREDAYQQYASSLAGIGSTNHSDDFYSLVGQYNSSDAYEADFKKEHRIDLWPNVSSSAMDSYYVENRVADFEEWAWRSWEDRVDYREMRSASKLSYRRSGYILALAVANRVVASIFAYHAVKSSRSGNQIQTGRYRVDFSGASNGYLTSLSLVRSF